MRKKVYVAAGYTTTFFGPGRPEFNPKKPMPPVDEYLEETAQGTCSQVPGLEIDQGVIGSFNPQRFIKQGNLPGFLPSMVPSLLGKPCVSVEGACGTGGKAIATGVKTILSDLADAVFVSTFEIQNSVKSVYGADILAGAGHFRTQRKNGHAYFFPAAFDTRAGVYQQEFGKEYTRKGLARWYEQAILKARKNPKAQEYANNASDPFEKGMMPPDPKRFLPHLNHTDCSKVSDGAASLVLLSEEGLARSGLSADDVVEIVSIGESQGDFKQPPKDPVVFSNTQNAVKKAFEMAGIKQEDLGLLEVHDCFTFSGLLSLEAVGIAGRGEAPKLIEEGLDRVIPVNLSGGLCGFGHPTGASGVRQMVDLLHQLTGRAANQIEISKPYGMMVSMGGDDITVSSLIVRRLSSI